MCGASVNYKSTFIETDGITDGQVQLKGPFGAATIIRLNGGTPSSNYWMVIGNFLSASTPPPGGGG